MTCSLEAFNCSNREANSIAHRLAREANLCSSSQGVCVHCAKLPVEIGITKLSLSIIGKTSTWGECPNSTIGGCILWSSCVCIFLSFHSLLHHRMIPIQVLYQVICPQCCIFGTHDNFSHTFCLYIL